MSERSVPSRSKFLADVMLGTLAKWLRILGYDTAYDNQITDEEIIRRCRSEDRIALTRDGCLAHRRRLSRCFFIQSDDLFDQIREVLSFLGETLEPDRILSRCLECNAVLENVPKATVKDRVPPYVFQTQIRFKRCPACQRLYWGGTHRRNIYERLKARL